MWAEVDRRMEQRRAKRRPTDEADKAEQERPKVYATFADLKNDMKNVSTDEWLGIPGLNYFCSILIIIIIDFLLIFYVAS